MRAYLGMCSDKRDPVGLVPVVNEVEKSIHTIFDG